MTHPFISYLEEKSPDIETSLQLLERPNIIHKRRDDLIIFKYAHKYQDEVERSCRGLIYDGKRKKIVCHPNDGTLDLKTFKVNVPIDECVIEENLEGTLINLYFYNNIWNVSTKFCINANESRFRAKLTYRQLFDKLFLHHQYKLLDKSFTYTFLLRIPEDKLVSNIVEPALFHLESQNNITGSKLYLNIGTPHISRITPLELLNKNGYSGGKLSYRLISQINNAFSWDIRGLMLYSKDRQYRCSIINPNYNKVLSLVKNQSDLKYLALESQFYKKNSEDILHYFPEYTELFDSVKSDYVNVANTLYSLYRNIYCRKIATTIPKKYQKIVHKIHACFKTHRANNLVFVIKIENVQSVLAQQDCPYLFTILYKI